MAVTVVNVIPAMFSGETQRDSEPNIAVDPANPQRIAASAFTPNPALTGAGPGPIFVSTDGGTTWNENNVLPGGDRTVDITLRFASASGILYAGILRFDNANLEILRSANFTAAGLMTVLLDRANDDQPYVEAATVLGGSGAGSDRVYVPNNDTSQKLTTGRTASVDQSGNAGTAAPPAGFGAPARIEPRATAALPASLGGGNQDGPSVRVAIHPQGRIYGVYFGWRTFASPTNTTDIVVVRDDNWGLGGYAAITDPSDTQAGVLVVTGRAVAALNSMLGTQRIGSQMAIAVDPRDPNIVYIAWCDGTAGAYTVRVRRSLLGGIAGSWSGDLRAITSATNPGLAINSRSRVGLLYQKLITGPNRWETHLEETTNEFGTITDTVLARVPDANGTYTGINPIGDYASLIAVGKDFYGIFSGNNTPNNANFPSGVSYQRFADFGTNQLFADAAHTVPVGPSIDPFFFHVSALAPGDDFYVRDWTDNPTSGDNGVEPSTHPVFYSTSDVWNRRGTLPGSFLNDQPENEDAGNGAGAVGDNWAFARIRRNQPSGVAQTVNAHFLVSKLGTGSNYVDASSADPDVSFPDPDPTVTFNPANLGPVVTTPLHWHLEAVASTHLCLAVEISTPNDPIVAPSLVGRAPGWPTTDLAVLNDNNKAQRNMGLSATPARGVGLSDTFWAIVHNAATYRRDVELEVALPPELLRRLKKPRLEIVGGRAQALKLRTMVVLHGMEPGENRWVGLTFTPPRGRAGEIAAAYVNEIVNGATINGFAVGAHLAPTAQCIVRTLELHRSVFTRIAALRGDDLADEEVFHVVKLLERNSVPPKMYVQFLKDGLGGLQTMIAGLRKGHDLGDPFGTARSRAEFVRRVKAVRGTAVDNLIVAHIDLLNRLDSFLTMLQLEAGDPADILQNVRWHRELYADVKALSEFRSARNTRTLCDQFIRGIERREATYADFPALLKRLRKGLDEAAEALPRLRLATDLQRLDEAGDSLAALQRAHRGLLLKLSTLRKGV
jgi:hypothetical protein